MLQTCVLHPYKYVIVKRNIGRLGSHELFFSSGVLKLKISRKTRKNKKTKHLC